MIETHKTLDDKTFYKSGDVGQIILVTDPDDEDEEEEVGSDQETKNGLTPPTFNIRKRKFRKKSHFDVYFFFFLSFPVHSFIF